MESNNRWFSGFYARLSNKTHKRQKRIPLWNSPSLSITKRIVLEKLWDVAPVARCELYIGVMNRDLIVDGGLELQDNQWNTVCCTECRLECAFGSL